MTIHTVSISVKQQEAGLRALSFNEIVNSSSLALPYNGVSKSARRGLIRHS